MANIQILLLIIIVVIILIYLSFESDHKQIGSTYAVKHSSYRYNPSPKYD